MSSDLLVFRLLGGHVILCGTQNITLKLPHKGRALLVYLLLTEKAAARKEMAAWLWPQVELDKALRSLRVLLATLRNKHHLGEYIQSDRHAVWFNLAHPTRCDVTQFQTIISAQLNAESTDIAVLQSGMDLYLGKFMLGFDVTNTVFDDWLLQQQIKLEELALRGLITLVNYLDAEDNPRAATEYAYRLVALDPWREASYRLLMRVLARCDRADAALHIFDQCAETLAQELGVTPEDETVELAEKIRSGDIAVIQPEPDSILPPQQQRPFLAPMITGPFVGRRQLMDRLQTALTQEDGRSHYCITGMGGVGKTTVAQHIAHALQDFFPDGVLWADAAQQNLQSITTSWAHVFGYDLHHISKESERLLTLRSILSTKKALIIIDDVVNAALIRPLLPESGDCKVLVTSRSVNVAHLLDALPIPLMALSPENGRSLLFHYIEPERAAREPQAIVSICKLLHNLPLAIVIAGNYLLERPQLRLVDFVAQLDAQTQKLDIHYADRQVRASFNLSWEALHVNEKRWFNLLGVFNGRSFAVDAFAAVADLDLWVADAQLQNLVQLSLVSRGENGRLHQHPLLAEFAREKLPPKDSGYLRLIAHFLNYAEVHQTNYERLHPEWANMTASIEVASRLHQWTAVIQLTQRLQPAWFARGLFTDARQAFSYAVEAAMYEEDEQVAAEMHLLWGQACLEQSDYAQAEAQFEQSLTLFQELNDEIGIGNVQYERARIAINHGKYDFAEEQLLASRQIHEKAGNQTGVANTLYRLARLHHRKGLNGEARTMCEEALVIHEATDNRLGMVRTQRLLSSITTMLKDFDAAYHHAESALSLAEAIRDNGEIAMAFYSLSMVNHNIQALSQALSFAERSLTLLEKMGDRHSQGLVLYQTCLIHKSAGNYRLAISAADEALPFLEQVGDALYIALALGHSGDCFSKLDEIEVACTRWEKAQHVAQLIENNKVIQALEQRLTACNMATIQTLRA